MGFDIDEALDNNRFFEMLRKELQEGVVKVKFLKKNGEERIMNCTWNMSEIPIEHHPTSDKPKDKDKNSDLYVVYDVEAKGWRSFHESSVIETSITIPNPFKGKD